LKLLNIKYKNKPFIHRRHPRGRAIIASKEIFCYARNFFLTIRSVLNLYLLG